MKKIFYFMLTVFMLVNTACKEDFLDVEAPSSVDEDFVFGTVEEADKVLAHLYDIWHDLDKRLFYDISSVGSDIERHPEPYTTQPRHIPEGLFASEMNINDKNAESTWKESYLIINRANIVLEAIGEREEYQAAVTSGQPNAWTQIYGEALCHRATNYKLLIKYFGDAPYFDYPLRNTAQTDTLGYSTRDFIYDSEIAALKKAVPLMYRLGDGGITAERFSGTYGDQLIARLAYDAAGYQLRRTDFDYGNISFEQWGQESSTWNAKYVRRSDYKDYYKIAKEYYLKVVNNPGSAYLIESDERGANFNNPFQRNFQYLLDLEVSPESIFECGYTRTQNSDWPYSFGRPSGGGGSNAYPPKNYGQGRIVTSFYFGDFDPADKRRDVTACVTANSGKASERLTSFVPGSREKGGLANNKFDESRMKNPYTIKARRSGVNWQQVRMANVMLNLAYAAAASDDEATAKTYFKKVRSRAFSAANQATKVNAYVDAMSGSTLLEGIEQELKLELAGEGLTRWDMILFGTMPERIQKMRDTQRAMIAGLETDGYYTFSNGVQISNWIYTKNVRIKDIDASLNLLTTQTPEGITESDPTYPVLVPGWRGTSDQWTEYISTLSSDLTHIAIRGMYRYIDPASTEGLDLIADGYELTPWAINIVGNGLPATDPNYIASKKDHYTGDLFRGYPDGSAAAGLPPRYILPLSFTTLSTSNGNLSQGYGHASE